ncbi:hypothetical protein [Mitsuaria sp. 7]|uniref:hypothetical protein n=1 Tax=Mitsuaria sp. 7 TaxID=1658665 RepID=UPI0012FB9C00|nr:hypothetical protein [Mitsuaria sp. 7]
MESIQQRIFGDSQLFAVSVRISAIHGYSEAELSYFIGGLEICARGHLSDIRQSFEVVVRRARQLQNCTLFAHETKAFLNDYQNLLNAPADRIDLDSLDLFNGLSLWFHDSLEDNLAFAIGCGDVIRIFCKSGKAIQEVRLRGSSFEEVIFSAGYFLGVEDL